MGLFDKVKDMTARAAEMAGDLSQSAKEEYEKSRQENERKKAEKEAYRNEMMEQTAAAAAKMEEEIRNGGSGEGPGIFKDLDEKALCSFTKEFYEKMVLPGSKAS